jgi:hypothetical protein
MTEPTTNSNMTVDNLLEKLDELTTTLTEDEHKLLRAILTVAQDVTEVFFPESTGATEATEPVDVPSFSVEFATAFQAKARAIMDYARTWRPTLSQHGTAGLVDKGTGWSSPAMVGR